MIKLIKFLRKKTRKSKNDSYNCLLVIQKKIFFLECKLKNYCAKSTYDLILFLCFFPELKDNKRIN